MMKRDYKISRIENTDMNTSYSQRSISNLYKKRNQIDLEPYFQREKVWKKARKQYFIDTLLKGWGIPKIYLLDEDTSSDKKNYACIDGKQRLTAIFEFISGDFPTNPKHDLVIGEKFYSDLSDLVSDKFDAYLLPVEEVSNAKPEEITELFKRLQLGVPLNSGENLMAINGFLKENIKGFYSHSFFKDKVSIQDTRYSHFVVCTQIAFLEINGISNLSLSKLEDFLKNNNDKSKIGLNIETKLKKIRITLDYLDKVFPKKSSLLKNRATIISCYLLVSKFLDSANINGKELKIKTFFDKFYKELDKQIGLGTDASDVKFIHYQNSVIQGADKEKAIKNRQRVLEQKLLEYNKSLYKILYPHVSLEERHNELFCLLEKKFKTQEEINNFLVKNFAKIDFPKCTQQRGLTKQETICLHVRNCLHHKSHGVIKNSHLSKSLVILEKAKTLLK